MFMVLLSIRQNYRESSLGSLDWMCARWPPTRRTRCKLDLYISRLKLSWEFYFPNSSQSYIAQVTFQSI